MNVLRINLVAGLLAVGTLVFPNSPGYAAQAHNSLQQFAVLSGASISCTGHSMISDVVSKIRARLSKPYTFEN